MPIPAAHPRHLCNQVLYCKKDIKDSDKLRSSNLKVRTPRSPRFRTGQWRKATAPSCTSTSSCVLLIVGSRCSASSEPYHSSRHGPISPSVSSSSAASMAAASSACIGCTVCTFGGCDGGTSTAVASRCTRRNRTAGNSRYIRKINETRNLNRTK